jgi:hypothetical protein
MRGREREREREREKTSKRWGDFVSAILKQRHLSEPIQRNISIFDFSFY